MSLHNDFPYSSAKLYCKTCKKATLHTWSFTHFICDECGRKWDDLLLRVNVRQHQYGKILYDCIITSEKPMNSIEYPAETFESLQECLDWMKTQVAKIQSTL